MTRGVPHPSLFTWRPSKLVCHAGGRRFESLPSSCSHRRRRLARDDLLHESVTPAEGSPRYRPDAAESPNTPNDNQPICRNPRPRGPRRWRCTTEFGEGDSSHVGRRAQPHCSHRCLRGLRHPPICRGFSADEGTRTLDLLHGNVKPSPQCSSMRSLGPTRLRSSWAGPAPGPAQRTEDYAQGGGSSSIRNGLFAGAT
jgi:hypothetical protein